MKRFAGLVYRNTIGRKSNRLYTYVCIYLFLPLQQERFLKIYIRRGTGKELTTEMVIQNTRGNGESHKTRFSETQFPSVINMSNSG